LPLKSTRPKDNAESKKEPTVANLLAYLMPAFLLMNIFPPHANFVIELPPGDTGRGFVDSSSAGGPALSGAGNSGQTVHCKMAHRFGNDVLLHLPSARLFPRPSR
jgi:hypothetical protein